MVGPLATYAEPHCYDLCDIHSDRLTAPRGWEVVRITPDPDSLRPTSDDLAALADAVREAARPRFQQRDADGTVPTVEVARRGHLRMLATTGEDAATEIPPVEPNWSLSEDDELDELDEVDEIDEIAKLEELEDLDELPDPDGQPDPLPVSSRADAERGDDGVRATVLNLPIRGRTDEHEPH